MRMGTLIGCTVLILGVTVAGASGQATAPKAPAAKSAAPALAQTLMAKEKAIISAVLAHDKAAFEKALSPDALMVDEAGYMSVGDSLKAFDGMKAESAVPSDMKVIMLDANAALVTYKLEQKGTFDGHPWPPLVYATTTWVNHGGAWHAAFHQESTAAKQ
jgi:uncharacterized protein DUF4440